MEFEGADAAGGGTDGGVGTRAVEEASAGIDT